MLNDKDYSGLSIEELTIEETKIKNQKTPMAFLTGIAIGIVTYAVVTKGFSLIPFLVLLLFLYIGYRNSQNLKKIQAEISAKNTK